MNAIVLSVKYPAQLSCDEIAKMTSCENNWLYNILQVATGCICME